MRKKDNPETRLDYYHRRMLDPEYRVRISDAARRRYHSKTKHYPAQAAALRARAAARYARLRLDPEARAVFRARSAAAYARRIARD